jgi:Tfp pilus assembly protein FimT
MCTQRRGLSVIEALVILAVLAVIVGLAIPRLDTARFRADANLRLVGSTLGQARRLAAESRQAIIVSFDIDRGRMRILTDVDRSGGMSPGEEVHWRALSDGAHFVAPPRGISGNQAATAVMGLSVAQADGMPSVTYEASGSATSPLEIYLQVNGRGKPVVRGITHTPSTGETVSWRLSDGGWKRGKP